MPDESKLPQWVRIELARLRNALDDRERQLAIAHSEALREGSTGKVIADCLGSDGFPLHDRSCIAFRLNGQRGAIRVMLRHSDGKEILDINGDSSILISPRSGNSAYITLDE